MIDQLIESLVDKYPVVVGSALVASLVIAVILTLQKTNKNMCDSLYFKTLGFSYKGKKMILIERKLCSGTLASWLWCFVTFLATSNNCINNTNTDKMQTQFC